MILAICAIILLLAIVALIAAAVTLMNQEKERELVSHYKKKSDSDKSDFVSSYGKWLK